MELAPFGLRWFVRRFGRIIYSRDWQYVSGGEAVRTPQAYAWRRWYVPTWNCSTTPDEWVMS